MLICEPFKLSFPGNCPGIFREETAVSPRSFKRHVLICNYDMHYYGRTRLPYLDGFINNLEYTCLTFEKDEQLLVSRIEKVIKKNCMGTGILFKIITKHFYSF